MWVKRGLVFGAAAALLIVVALWFNSRGESCAGRKLDPSQDYLRVISTSPAGTTFCFGPGVYRLSAPIVPQPNDSFIGEEGAVLDGARRLSFERIGEYWAAGGQSQERRTRGRCVEGDICTRPEALFVDDEEWEQVSSPSELGEKTFFFDYVADRILIASDPGPSAEASFAPGAFRGSAPGVTVRNLEIIRFDNAPGRGAVDLRGPGSQIEGNEIAFNGGIGVCTGGRSRIVDNHVHHQGQLGLCGSGVGIVVQGNEISFNNTQGHRYGWEAGGAKWVNTSGLHVIGNSSHDNEGIGLWTDLNNIDTVYEGNTVSHNRAAGIVHEASYRAVIRDNVISDNGSSDVVPYDGAGIKIAESPDVEVHANRILRNKAGIAVTFRDRSSTSAVPVRPLYGAHESVRLLVHDNLIATDGSTGFAVGFVAIVPAPTFDLFSPLNGNVFEDNRYQVSATQPRSWRWLDSLTWEEWRALGLDSESTVIQVSP